MTSQSSIWSPAAIPPVNDILNSNSCMQRGGYPMPNTQPASYPHQNYGPSSYYSDMGYLNHMQLPVMSNQMNQMNGNQVSYGSMPAPQIPRSNPTDCLEYKDTSSWPKFQVLWFNSIYVDLTNYFIMINILIHWVNVTRRQLRGGAPVWGPSIRGCHGYPGPTRQRSQWSSACKFPRFTEWILGERVYKLSQKHSSMIFKCLRVNITHLIYELTPTSRWHGEHLHCEYSVCVPMSPILTPGNNLKWCNVIHSVSQHIYSQETKHNIQ